MTRRGAIAMAFAPATGSQPLFDGRTFSGWTLGDGGPVTHSWSIEDGTLATVADARGRSDLLCTQPLRAFELEFDFRLSRGSNTGVKYFVSQMLRYLNLEGSYGAIGLEFQLATDDAEGVEHDDQRLGALYGILPVDKKPSYTVGEWGSAKLVCRADGCEHWINGQRVLAFDPTSASFKKRLREVAVDPGHSIVGAAAALVVLRRRASVMPEARIALQQHSTKAWFRSLRLRNLV